MAGGLLLIAVLAIPSWAADAIEPASVVDVSDGIRAPEPAPAPWLERVDTDGDGIDDSDDNCPDVSNPAQADEDADGVGDACDNCPDYSNQEQGPARLLSGPLLVPDGHVGRFRISPDGMTVVYISSQEVRSEWQLYSVPLEGGDPVRLNAVVESVIWVEISPDGTTVVYRSDSGVYRVPIHGGTPTQLSPVARSYYGLTISPDGQWVVFEDSPTVPGEVELYSVPIDGGQRVGLSDTLPDEAWTRGYRVSADSTRVVFRAIEPSSGDMNLHSVPIDGGPAVRLNAPLPAGRDVQGDYQIGPRSRRVFYRARESFTGPRELYSVPIDGGTVTKLNLSPAFTDIGPFEITPDSENVVYRGGVESRDRELFRVPAGGGPSSKLHSRLDGDVGRFAITPDGSRVVYVGAETTGFEELSVVPIAGGPRLSLTAGRAYRIQEFDVDPTSTMVVFRGDRSQPVNTEVFAVPLSGGDLLPLNGELMRVAGVAEYVLAPNGRTLAYFANELQPSRWEWFGVSTDGGPAKPISVRNGLNLSQVSLLSFTPDGSHAVFAARLGSGPSRLYVAPVPPDADDDGLPNACDPCTDRDGDGFGDLGYPANSCFPDACPLVFDPAQNDVDADGPGDACDNCPFVENGDQLDEDHDGVGDACDECLADDVNDADADGLCAVEDNCPFDTNANQGDADADGIGDACDDCPSWFDPRQGAPRRMNGDLVADGNVTDTVAVSPDGAWTVYVADQDGNNRFDLYSVPTGGGTPRRIGEPMVIGLRVEEFTITDDSSTVVYRTEATDSGDGELYAVPIEGGTVVKLNSTLVPGGTVSDYVVGSDSRTVVYVANQESSLPELFATTTDGQAPVKLNGPLGPFGISRFALDPTATRVGYIARETSSQLELYSVPIGGGASIRLNRDLPPFAHLSDFLFSPDGSTVVYRGEQDRSSNDDLFAVPSLGGPVIRLNSRIEWFGDVERDYRITPDGTTVLYRGNQRNFPNDELYAVSIDGENHRNLNGPIQRFGNVYEFVVTPDGSSVVYWADQRVNDVTEVFVVPVAGGEPVRLSREFPTGADALAAVVSPDGRWVAYRADDDRDFDDYEMFLVSIDGGESRDLGPSLSRPGFDGRAKFTADSSVVVFLADDRHPGRPELFAARTDAGGSHRLSAPFPFGGEVLEPWLPTPDASTVVYRASQEKSFVDQLYAVPLVTDGDGDGILGDCDECPLDPLKIEPGICDCGVPDDETEPPRINCPGDITVECGDDLAPEFTGLATATDACGIGAVDYEDMLETTCGSAGTLTRTWTAVDLVGNPASCEQRIALVDTTPPDLSAPDDLMLECSVTGGVPATDERISAWTGRAEAHDTCGTAAVTHDLSGLVPLGDTVVTFTAVDACGNAVTAGSSVRVQDTTPPVLRLEAAPAVLWPPNHSMVPVHVEAIVEDICGSTALELAGATSNEPDDARGGGDGHTTGDIRDVEIGTPDADLLLRAERSGTGNGRIYEVVYRAIDAAGNEVTGLIHVLVPHGAPAE